MNENGAYVSKVWEQGWTIYQTLEGLNEDYNLEEHLMKITRKGSGQNDTTYTILPVPNGGLSKEQLQAVSTVPLPDLNPNAPRPNAEALGDSDERGLEDADTSF